jgi:hypothetical protein
MQPREVAAMVEPRLTAAEAASAIVGLINSRPVSPWAHEIEAIIARVASTVPQLVPVDLELVRLISEWREQRDIIDRTVVETAGILPFEEAKPSEMILGKATVSASDLAQKIWQRARCGAGDRSTR